MVALSESTRSGITCTPRMIAAAVIAVLVVAFIFYTARTTLWTWTSGRAVRRWTDPSAARSTLRR
jgi:hypothetical protein